MFCQWGQFLLYLVDFIIDLGKFRGIVIMRYMEKFIFD